MERPVERIFSVSRFTAKFSAECLRRSAERKSTPPELTANETPATSALIKCSCKAASMTDGLVEMSGGSPMYKEVHLAPRSAAKLIALRPTVVQESTVLGSNNPPGPMPARMHARLKFLDFKSRLRSRRAVAPKSGLFNC